MNDDEEQSCSSPTQQQQPNNNNMPSDDDEADMDEYGDMMHAGNGTVGDDYHNQMQQMKAKFKFKITSSNNNNNGSGGGAQGNNGNGLFPITSSTSYGTKFIDLRKTFQNFNANSNKAL
jgi:hypothetical protein